MDSAIFISFAGLLALILGVLLITSKETIAKASDKMKEIGSRKAGFFDKVLIKNNVGVGISLVLVGIYLFFVAFYVAVKTGMIGG